MYDAGQPSECGHDLEGGIWNGCDKLEGGIRNGEHGWTVCRLQPRGHSSAYFDRRVGSGVAAEPDGTRPY